MLTSVVVATCRRHPWLALCLQSVVEQADEVVVVDNGSPGGWATEQASLFGARHLRLERNGGAPRGINAGLRAARGDVIALLNDDAVAGDGWLSHAVTVLADPSVAAVAPKLLLAAPHAEVDFGDDPWLAPGDPRPLGRAIHSATVTGRDVLALLTGSGIHELESRVEGHRRELWRWTTGEGPFFVPLPDGSSPEDILINGEPVPVRRVVNLINNAGSYLSQDGHGGDYGFETPDHPHFDRPADRFAACAAAMVTTSDTLHRVGLLAASFHAYYEDTDWCWRAQLADLRIRYEPATVVRHVRGVSSGGAFDPTVRFLAARNRLHCLARNAPLGVLATQLRRAVPPARSAGTTRAVASRVAVGLVERRLLARKWRRTPSEVFLRWAGVGEVWPGQRGVRPVEAPEADTFPGSRGGPARTTDMVEMGAEADRDFGTVAGRTEEDV